MEKEDKEGLSVKKSNVPPRFAHICKTVPKKEERKSSGVLTASSVKITTRHTSMKILTPVKLRRRRTRTPSTGPLQASFNPRAILGPRHK